MRKIIYLFLGLLLVCLPMSAKKPGEGSCCPPEKFRKEIREFKLKFLAQEMDLREDQQKQFFTLYTQMSDEKEALMRSVRQAVEKVEKMDNATESDYRSAAEAMTRAREQELAIDKKYEEKFSTFLTKKQIFKMNEAERKFRDKLNEMRHNRHPRHPKR